MKTNFYFRLAMVCLLLATGCKKSDPVPVNGSVVFWNLVGDEIGNVEVTIKGTIVTVTKDFNSAPDCNTTGAATFSLAPGTYDYSAREVSGLPPLLTWSGTVTITSTGCSKKRLCLSAS